MFDTHNPVINEYMQSNYKNMVDGIMFVVLSVKTPFHTMQKQMEDYRVNGVNSKYVWGFKRQTLEYLQENGKDLYDELMDLSSRKQFYSEGQPIKFKGRQILSHRDKQMMLVLTDVPGLGVVKAGFVMQMMFGRVGCIDVHNQRRLYSVNPKDLQFVKNAKDHTKLVKIVNYVNICKHNNSTQRLWDHWCTLLTDKRCNKGRFTCGEDVSAFHVTALVGA